MVFLPIVQRELAVAARRRSTHWVRLAFACAGSGVAGWMVLVSSSSTLQMNGRPLFFWLTNLCFAYAFLAGIRFTANSLSTEKREGTLGLLFLTDLKGYDVILGKFVANSLDAIYGLVAILPVLALPVVMGGLTYAEFIRVAAVLLNTLFLSLAIGMAASAIARREQMSTGFAFLVLCLLAWLTMLPQNPWVAARPLLQEAILLLCPIFEIFRASEPVYRTTRIEFWIGFAATHILAWLSLMLGSYFLARNWREATPSQRRERFHLWLRDFTQGNPQTRRAFRRRTLALNPIQWLNSRERWHNWLAWIPVVSGFGLWIWGRWKFPVISDDPAFLLLVLFVLSMNLKIWIASESARRILAARRDGALELILVTPLRVREFVQGHMRALLWKFGLPMLTVLVIHVLLMARGWDSHKVGGSQDFWGIAFLLSAIMLVTDSIALAWVGLRLGMTAKQSHYPGLSASLRVLVPPWLALACLAVLVSFSGVEGFVGGAAMVLLLFAIGISCDFFFAATASSDLHTSFRTLASRGHTKRFRRAIPTGLLNPDAVLRQGNWNRVRH